MCRMKLYRCAERSCTDVQNEAVQMCRIKLLQMCRMKLYKCAEWSCTDVQNEGATDMQKEAATDIQKEAATDMQKEAATDVQNEGVQTCKMKLYKCAEWSCYRCANWSCYRCPKWSCTEVQNEAATDVQNEAPLKLCRENKWAAWTITGNYEQLWWGIITIHCFELQWGLQANAESQVAAALNTDRAITVSFKASNRSKCGSISMLCPLKRVNWELSSECAS